MAEQHARIPDSVEQVSPADLPVPTQPVQQVKTPYVTAVAVQRPRSIAEVERKFLDECSILGEDAYYSWSVKSDGGKTEVVEGMSIEGALAALRAYGNCAVDMGPIEETFDAYVFTSYFIDLEAGITLPRKFRQSKQWKVYGKMDEFRKEDIRFQIGQSKATRNVILNGIPRWLINRGSEKAKAGVRSKIEKLIKEKSLAEAQRIAMESLRKIGVSEARVLAKLERPTVAALTVEDLVRLSGDIRAIQTGQEFAESLFPVIDEQPKESPQLKELKEKVAAKQAQKPEAEQKQHPNTQQQTDQPDQDDAWPKD